LFSAAGKASFYNAPLFKQGGAKKNHVKSQRLHSRSFSCLL